MPSDRWFLSLIRLLGRPQVFLDIQIVSILITIFFIIMFKSKHFVPMVLALQSSLEHHFFLFLIFIALVSLHDVAAFVVLGQHELVCHLGHDVAELNDPLLDFGAFRRPLIDGLSWLRILQESWERCCCIACDSCMGFIMLEWRCHVLLHLPCSILRIRGAPHDTMEAFLLLLRQRGGIVAVTVHLAGWKPR